MHLHQEQRPLPGTEPPLRGLFVDRWGTLLEGGKRGFCSRPEDLLFQPGAVDALFRAQQAGWTIYLIGNEDAVAKGRLSDAAWERVSAALVAQLASLGVDVRRNYACLEHPSGKGTHRRPSVFLLPDTGVFFHAAQEDGVELPRSWVIGDSTLELAAGERAGCKIAGVRTGLGLGDKTLQVDPRFVGENLAEAVDHLLGSLLGRRVLVR
jgi:D-glycero-D-manno-heptose 1,7-bisphosphate phosphatase